MALFFDCYCEVVEEWVYWYYGIVYKVKVVDCWLGDWVECEILG